MGHPSQIQRACLQGKCIKGTRATLSKYKVHVATVTIDIKMALGISKERVRTTAADPGFENRGRAQPENLKNGGGGGQAIVF